MAHGKDLTFQMSRLSGSEQTISSFFGKYMESSFRENTASSSQVFLQCSLNPIFVNMFGLLHYDYPESVKDLLCLIKGTLHLQYATFCLEAERMV